MAAEKKVVSERVIHGRRVTIIAHHVVDEEAAIAVIRYLLSKEAHRVRPENVEQEGGPAEERQ